MRMSGRVLVIAGSDSGGGAGIQADIKTVTALGGYAASAITALTAQDTRAVHGIHDVPPEFLRQQIAVVLEDIGADAIKIGMLHRAELVEVVVGLLRGAAASIPVVLDPVMAAKGGEALLENAAAQALRRDLLNLTSLLTPNLPEAAVLTGREIGSVDDMVQAAALLLTLGPQAVLLKGGHLPGEVVYDVLVTADGTEVMQGPRIDSINTHGTGCTLASAIATGLAQGLVLRDAVLRGRAYVAEAIRTAPSIGKGHGPLNHAHTVRRFDGS
jgi:hydroxymethylpyrimidine/phosphomethylpyrimidine kinase